MEPEDEESKDTEFQLWLSADARQKSYIVQVLHWFHYRPTRLRGSWRQEEVLTWELIRALDLLPQALFVRPLLERIAARHAETQEAIIRVLEQTRIAITAYPSLELQGSKRNCRSDVGFGGSGRPTVWIEAKTAPFKAVALDQQLQQQRTSMARLMGDTPSALVTLLPQARALPAFPNVSWDDVLETLSSCQRRLAEVIPDPDLAYGYLLVARELASRIESHPNRYRGWV